MAKLKTHMIVHLTGNACVSEDTVPFLGQKQRLQNISLVMVMRSEESTGQVSSHLLVRIRLACHGVHHQPIPKSRKDHRKVLECSKKKKPLFCFGKGENW